MSKSNVGRLMGYILLGAGIGHFIFPGPLDSIVPPALPGDPRIYTYLSGVAEILIGASLLTDISVKVFGKPLKLWGAYGAFALFIAVYPANIYMAIDWSDRGFPDALIAYARLPFQFYFLWAAWKLIKAIQHRAV